MDLTAFILAGGQSTRMGADKAFVELDGKSLLERAVELVHLIATEVRIVGDSEKFSAFAPTTADVYPGCGPLGGIHAALATTSTELNLMLAVDLPFVSSSLLQYLVLRACETAAEVIVPRMGGRLQPLCAVYRRQFCDIAERSLRAGKNKIDPLFADVATCVIDEPELTAMGFSPELFQNLNTPEELDRARQKLKTV